MFDLENLQVHFPRSLDEYYNIFKDVPRKKKRQSWSIEYILRCFCEEIACSYNKKTKKKKKKKKNRQVIMRRRLICQTQC